MKSDQSKFISIESMSEHSTFKMIVGLGFLSVIFYFAVYYFSQLLDDVNAYRYEMVAERFNISMSHAYKEWQLKGKKKDYVLVDYLVNAPTMKDNKPDMSKKVARKMVLQLSEKGWPINVDKDNRELNCLALWMYFSHNSDQPKGLFNLTENLEIKQSDMGCWFYQGSNEGLQFMFSYHPDLGQVVSAKKNLLLIKKEQ